LKPVEPDYLTDEDKETIALIAGGIVVVLVIILMFKVPSITFDRTLTIA
jgi:hypothetical protein